MEERCCNGGGTVDIVNWCAVCRSDCLEIEVGLLPFPSFAPSTFGKIFSSAMTASARALENLLGTNM